MESTCSDLHNFDEVIANTQLDKYGRLRACYHIQKCQVVDFSLEIYYRAPTRSFDYRICYQEDEQGEEFYEIYYLHPHRSWLRTYNYGVHLMSIDTMQQYKRIFRQLYRRVPQDLFYFIELMQRCGEEFDPKQQLNFFTHYDPSQTYKTNITIRWSFERFKKKMEDLAKFNWLAGLLSASVCLQNKTEQDHFGACSAFIYSSKLF